ncbi:MAG: TRASH domain-containing protein [Caldivirga sp.]
MPFLLNTGTGQVRCTYCGRVISGQPIVVKTCCINRPWVFCSEECYNRFLRQ